VTSLSWSADGKHLAVGTSASKVRVTLIPFNSGDPHLVINVRAIQVNKSNQLLMLSQKLREASSHLSRLPLTK
jgi:hypothetical protein